MYLSSNYSRRRPPRMALVTRQVLRRVGMLWDSFVRVLPSRSKSAEDAFPGQLAVESASQLVVNDRLSRRRQKAEEKTREITKENVARQNHRSRS